MKLPSRQKLKLFASAAGLCLIIAATALINLQWTVALSGSDWRAGRIIDDTLFTNKNAMSVAQIQSFLESKMPVCDTNGTGMVGGITRAQYGTNNGNPPPFTCLKDYYENPDNKASNYGGQPIPAGAKSAAQLIWEAGQQHNINPQVLLVTLQKEQGLITDDWPFKRQYEKAMGAHCPDTAPCDPAYAGFSAQMLEGAELFRYYLDNMNQSWWPYAKPGNRSVLYNPNGACGSSNVFIENYATAALYTYTPYQPNAAALANLGGSGDSCSAYGNRNFWRDFNNWFGPSTSLGYTLAIANNGDTRQWVIMNGKRYLVPTPEVKEAWGLPETPITWDHNYLGSFVDGPNLSRLMRPAGSLTVYFLDQGRRHRVMSNQMLDIWNSSVSMGQVIDVSAGLGELPQDYGDLGYAARRLSDAQVYLIDSGTKRHITDPNVLAAWTGDTPNVVSLSDAFYNSLPTGGSISTPKMTDGANTYLMDGNRKLLMDGVTSQLFPAWTSHSVTPAIYNFFGTAQLSYVIKAWDSPTVYVVDQGLKHQVIDPDVLDAWQSATYPSHVTVTTRGLTGLISIGTQISDYFASNGSNKYVVDRYKHPIASVLQNAYTSSRTVYAASSNLLSVFPAGNEVNGQVRPFGSSAIYLLTNSGNRRHFINGNRLHLWTENHMVTELRPANLNRYPDGGGLNAFVTDGSSNYLMAGGQKHLINNATKSNWRLGTPDTLSDGTLSRYSDGAAIVNELQGGGAYFFVHEGSAYGTIDRNVAEMWGAIDAPSLSLSLINEYLGSNMMTRIVKSNQAGDSRLFIIDRGILYRLYPNHSLNLNAGPPFTAVNPNVLTVQDWTTAVVRDEGGTTYAVDGGTKRPVPAGIIRDHWTFGNLANAPTMTNGFLNTLPTYDQVERAIKGSGPTIYSAENFTKRWIQNPNTYSSGYAPYTSVSDALLGALPDGNPL